MFKFLVSVTLDDVATVSERILRIDIIDDAGLVKSINVACGGIIRKYFMSKTKIAVFVDLDTSTNGEPAVIHQIDITLTTGA